MPRLLDYNRHLLEELSDPELKGSRNQDGTRWDPLLSVAYDVSTETLVAKERWRWFYMYGTTFWQSGTEAREQDFHSPEQVRVGASLWELFSRTNSPADATALYPGLCTCNTEIYKETARNAKLKKDCRV